jgi:hypothetical protein
MRKNKLTTEVVGKWVDTMILIHNEMPEYNDYISYQTRDAFSGALNDLERLLGALLVTERREKKNVSNMIYQG